MMYDLETFCSRCEARRCPRNTIYNAKTCVRDAKRKTCYDKYLRKQEKEADKINLRLEESQADIIDKDIWERDVGYVPDKKNLPGDSWKKVCRFWRCLTIEEQNLFLTVNREHLWLCRNVDKAHWRGRGSHPELSHKLENIVLINRLVHTRLDTYKDPITGDDITADVRDAWFQRMIEVK